MFRSGVVLMSILIGESIGCDIKVYRRGGKLFSVEYRYNLVWHVIGISMDLLVSAHKIVRKELFV